MSADVQKYAILVEGVGMVHFDCAPNDLAAFCAQIATETGKPCPALERWSHTYNAYIPMTNENIECQMKVKIVVPPSKPITDDITVPGPLRAAADKFRSGSDAGFVLVNTRAGSKVFCFDCGSIIGCPGNKIDNFVYRHCPSAKHTRATKGSGLLQLLKAVSEGDVDEVKEYIEKFRIVEKEQGVKRPPPILHSPLQELLQANACLENLQAERKVRCLACKVVLNSNHIGNLSAEKRIMTAQAVEHMTT